MFSLGFYTFEFHYGYSKPLPYIQTQLLTFLRQNNFFDGLKELRYIVSQFFVYIHKRPLFYFEKRQYFKGCIHHCNTRICKCFVVILFNPFTFREHCFVKLCHILADFLTFFRKSSPGKCRKLHLHQTNTLLFLQALPLKILLYCRQKMYSSLKKASQLRRF